jgi:hypothetical protein
VQLFYLDYNGDNDGLFTAANISASLRDIPLPVFFQGILPLWSNISPGPEFKWNVGLAYSIASSGFYI